MKLTHEQRLAVAAQGVDPDAIENPAQVLPSVEQRIVKLEQRIKDRHPRAELYREKLKVYHILRGTDADTSVPKPWWKRLIGG